MAPSKKKRKCDEQEELQNADTNPIADTDNVNPTGDTIPAQCMSLRSGGTGIRRTWKIPKTGKQINKKGGGEN